MEPLVLSESATMDETIRWCRHCDNLQHSHYRHVHIFSVPYPRLYFVAESELGEETKPYLVVVFKPLGLGELLYFEADQEALRYAEILLRVLKS